MNGHALGDSALAASVARAQGGDRDALDDVLRAVERDVHRIALRFLWHPDDADDATQDILIRVARGLGAYRGDSSFRTWVYRIACNTLSTLGKKRAESRSLSFDEFAEDLAHGLSDDGWRVAHEQEIDHELLLEEVKIGCTLAMLLCLDRDHRLAYILGEILELDHREGAEVLAITPAAFRKRLSRARASIASFMVARCGLVNSANACRCRRRIATAVASGRVDPAHLLFASSLEQARRFPQVLGAIRQLDEARRAAALYRSHPEPRTSRDLVSLLKNRMADAKEPHG